MTFLELNLPRFGLAGLLFVLSWLGLVLLRRVLLQRWGRFERDGAFDWHDLVVELVRRTFDLFLLMTALLLAAVLALPPEMIGGLQKVFGVVFFVQAGFWGVALVDYFIRRRHSAASDSGSTTAAQAIGILTKIAIWVFVILLMVENIAGLEASSLITSLGIGGIAVALAVQKILGDLFSALSITLDKPFEIGDFIIVDGLSGKVEKIGLKSTRIRSNTGEVLVFSNSDLLASRIRNFSGLSERRIILGLGIPYETPPEKLEKIPQLLKEIVEAQPNTTFERAHFRNFGESALAFELAYVITESDGVAAMDCQQQVNLQILQRFRQEAIGFAYPTRTVYLPSDAGATS